MGHEGIRTRITWVWGDTVEHEPPIEGTADMSPRFGSRGPRGLLYGYPVGATPGGPNFSMLLENCIIDNPGHYSPAPPQSGATTFWRLYTVGEKLHHIEDFGLLEEALQAAEIWKMNEESRKNWICQDCEGAE